MAGFHDLEQVLVHPLCGHSWEGYCIEQIVTRLPKGTTASHYRTHAEAEVDLVLENPSGETVALKIKRTLSPGFHKAPNSRGTSVPFIKPEGELKRISKYCYMPGRRFGYC